jgi:subtilisin-like proprotein convertase family protein
MKITRLFILPAATALLLPLASARGDETLLTFSVNQAIPDANANGLSLFQTVSVGDGLLSDLKVTLNLSGGYNGDLYAYLVAPGGGFSVLLNRVGIGYSANPFGYSDAGFNVTLSDAAANGSIHTYQSVLTTGGAALTGTWQPDGLNLDPRSSASAFQSAGQTAMLTSLTGGSANGTWTLFLADLSAGSQATLVSWGLDLTLVPEPQALSFAALAILAAAWKRRQA